MLLLLILLLLPSQVTHEPKYLYQAAQFGLWCQDYGTHGCRTADRPLSLYEGLAGTLYFLVDLEDPENAHFPAFVLEWGKKKSILLFVISQSLHLIW